MFPGEAANLNTDEKETVEAVLESYGHLNGQQLSNLAYGERPWQEARHGIPEGAASTNEVTLEVMQDYYGALQSASSV